MRIVAFLTIVVTTVGSILLYRYASSPQPVTPRLVPAAPTDVDLSPVVRDTALAAIQASVSNSEPIRFENTHVGLFYSDPATRRAKWLVTGNVNSQPFGVTVLLDNGKFSVASTAISNTDLGSTRTYQSTGQQEQQPGRHISEARVANAQRDMDKQKQIKSDILYQQQQQRKYEHQVEEHKAAQRATHYFGQ